MYGKKYQWIIMGTYSEGWWNVDEDYKNCTKEEIHTALEQAILTDLLPLSTTGEITVSGIVSKYLYCAIERKMYIVLLDYKPMLNFFGRNDPPGLMLEKILLYGKVSSSIMASVFRDTDEQVVILMLFSLVPHPSPLISNNINAVQK